MTKFQQTHNGLSLGNVNLQKLADDYATPLYVYSGDILRQKAQSLLEALQENLESDTGILIAFACKANSNIAVLNLLQKEGLGADIVSGGELLRAIKAGVAPEKIVFSGVGKSDEEIRLALHHHIHQINVESRAELLRIEDIAKEMNKVAPVVFRINPDVDAKTHAKITTGKTENKFGMSPASAYELYRHANDSAVLSPKGLSMHIGSQLTTVSPYESAFNKMASYVTDLRAEDLNVERTDIGGGIGIVYHNEERIDLHDYARLVKKHIEPLGTQIILEPGRYIAGEAGVLLSRVLYVKEEYGRHFAILDAGMNDLMRPALYEAYHHPELVRSNPNSEETRLYDLVGPVCETGDTFHKQIELPILQRGDIVALHGSGAYGFVMASNYNTRGLPAEVLVDKEQVYEIRKRQNFDDLIAGEVIPA